MIDNYYSVIMAGGVGKRFWPRSRRQSPKQLLDIVGDDTMVNLTINRLKKITPIERIFIITNFEQAEMIMAQNDEMSWDNFIIEPSGKNTAPAIGLAAMILNKMNPDAVMGIFPSDHLITNTDSFEKYLNEAISHAERANNLLTFGINPNRPATGYGYIQIDPTPESESDAVFRVKTFAEKPNLNTAKRFIKSNEFLWNSGMFVWKTSSILKAIHKHLPDLYEPLMHIEPFVGKKNYQDELQTRWRGIQPISIDYGILENANNVSVVRGDFDWSDVGSWEAVYELEEKDKHGNVKRAEGSLLESTNNYIFSKNMQVFARNIHDLIIIEDKGVILVLPREESESVKEIVDMLPVLNKEDLL